VPWLRHPVKAKTEYPDDDEGLAMLVDCASGWGDALVRLKFYLEKNISAK